MAVRLDHVVPVAGWAFSVEGARARWTEIIAENFVGRANGPESRGTGSCLLQEQAFRREPMVKTQIFEGLGKIFPDPAQEHGHFPGLHFL